MRCRRPDESQESQEPQESQERREPVELAAAALVSAAVSAAGAAMAVRGESAPDGFGDGAAYRAMARGEPGAPPFNRRVLMPAVVRLLRLGPGREPDAVAGFRSVALASVAGAALGTGLLAARVARCCGASSTRTRLAGVLSGALVPAMPHSTRMAVAMPVFNDQLAVALGALWLLLGRSEHRVGAWLAPPVALATALTREQWLLTGLFGLRRPRPAAAAAHLAAALLALATVLAQPAGPGSEAYPPGLALRRLVSRAGVTELLWGLGSTVGLLPVLLPAALRRRAGQPNLAALLRIAAIQTSLALVGGSDTPRLVYGGLPFLTAATVGVAAADRNHRLAPVLAATLALWQPLRRPAGSQRGYEEFFLPYMHGLLTRRVAGAAARLLGGLAAVRVLRLLGDSVTARREVVFDGWRRRGTLHRPRGRGLRRS